MHISRFILIDAKEGQKPRLTIVKQSAFLLGLQKMASLVKH